MRHVNGVYTQSFNRRHGKVGHLFQGRFKAILVDRDAYLIQLCPYVELNPVRAGMVAEPGAWLWSSYRAHTGQAEQPPWLDTAGLHGYLLQRPALTAADHRRAAKRYAQFVADAHGAELWSDALRQQIYLGDADFVDRMQALAEAPRKATRDTPKVQRSALRPLAHWLKDSDTREERCTAPTSRAGSRWRRWHASWISPCLGSAD